MWGGGGRGLKCVWDLWFYNIGLKKTKQLDNSISLHCLETALSMCVCVCAILIELSLG